MNEGVEWNADALTVGPDGALWETWWANAELIRIGTDGSMQEYTLSACPIQGTAEDIAAGPDGDLWVTAATPGPR